LAEFLSKDWNAWPDLQRACLDLLNNAEHALSPRRLFETPPLASCDEGSKEWLPDLVHLIWIRQTNLRGAVADARRMLDNANDIYAELEVVFGEPDKVRWDHVRDSIGKVQAFTAQVEAFSRVISSWRSMADVRQAGEVSGVTADSHH
jgi:hypothetical protein